MNKTTDFEADAKIPMVGLGQVTALAEKLLKLDNEIEKTEKRLKALKDEHARIETGDLPDLLDSVNMEEFALSDGTKFKVLPVIKASIPTSLNIAKQRDPEKRDELQERQDAAFKYLRDNEADSLIQNQLVVIIEKGKDNMVGDIEAYIQEHGLQSERNTSVNAQSLSAYVREKIQKGHDVPFDTLSVFSGRKTKITKAR